MKSPKPPPSQKQRLLDFFLLAAKKLFDRWDGCIGAETLMYALKGPYERGWSRGLLVDVGANVGKDASDLAMIFSSGFLYERIDVTDPSDDLCVKMGPKPSLWAFEPNPENLRPLTEQLSFTQQFMTRQGKPFQFRVVHAAVSSARGVATFLHGGSFDQVGALGNVSEKRQGDWAALKRTKQSTVEVTTLDHFMGKGSIFLLKIDTEGHDDRVLLGARRLLRARRIRFIVFEVLRGAATTGRKTSLWRVVERMNQMQYRCFLMTRTALIPLWGVWWNENYERWKTWANVFCGVADDPALFHAYVGYGTNPLTLEFALAHLKPKNGSAPACTDWPECTAV
eukprot:gb/GFBE01074534.1/.p1 GENE.gb/GFBE01074534.1/~~gb/GFBE01074534.1/.p1  ORF type:complete len:339 (+),score=36.52 gb/GFBE01074534.1/:1-1017(+)